MGALYAAAAAVAEQSEPMAAPVKIEALSDEQLAAAAAREQSDGPAFVELVRRYQELVWRICCRLLGSHDQASDAAQEVFVRLFLHRTRFRAESRYATWVYAVCVRTCLAQRRAQSRRARREQAGCLPENRLACGGPQAEDFDIAMDLMQMLELLDEDDRALLVMKYAEGYSYDELSEMFGLSVSACKMRVSRARAELRRRFAHQNAQAEIDAISSSEELLP